MVAVQRNGWCSGDRVMQQRGDDLDILVQVDFSTSRLVRSWGGRPCKRSQLPAHLRRTPVPACPG